ncbi:hypothetical protein [Lysinibacillus fusiformis]|uniref:hypothetical protein n=1 Tax=Lysinibacillus fusiformis TaxID=28031 RepID=UPI003015AC74
MTRTAENPLKNKTTASDLKSDVSLKRDEYIRLKRMEYRVKNLEKERERYKDLAYNLFQLYVNSRAGYDFKLGEPEEIYCDY